MADSATLAPEMKARMKRTAANAVETKTINLALQGGGAHGAFAWGVLDRVLEDERIAFEGLSATSAGAMNAVTLAYGMTLGGREGAKKALAHAIAPMQLFGKHSVVAAAAQTGIGWTIRRRPVLA